MNIRTLNISRLHYYFLIAKYPALRKYIDMCYNSGRIDEFLDFLFEIDLDIKKGFKN